MPILCRVNENVSLLFQSGGEDVEMATCLQNIGIYGEHSADQTGVGLRDTGKGCELNVC
jgi:hypothetical protein